MKTVFELVEGVAYKAMLNGKAIGRTFMVKAGKLYNSSGGDDYRQGCVYVPMRATFSEADGIPREAQFIEVSERDSVELPRMIPNMIYERWDDQYARVDNQLLRKTDGSREWLPVSDVGLGDVFRPTKKYYYPEALVQKAKRKAKELVTW